VIAHRITRWPLGPDASLTPTPAEPRNVAVALKSITLPTLAALVAEAGIKAQVSPEHSGDRPGSPVTRLPLAEHAPLVVSANREYVERLEDRVAFRLATETKTGRVLSAANDAEIGAVIDSLNALVEVRDRLTALREKARPKQAEETADTEGALRRETDRLRTDHWRGLSRTPLTGASL
jgi:hypothetical protein